MGEVLLATDIGLERQVALKVSSPSRVGPRSAAPFHTRGARGRRPLPSQRRDYLRVGEASGVDYIAMEYIEGRTLSERIGGTTIALDEMADSGSRSPTPCTPRTNAASSTATSSPPT